MKRINNVPNEKQERNEKKPTAGWSLFGDKSVYADNPKARNYKYGDDATQGPNYGKRSKEADGGTSPNAGVFK
jgi:hypothetical protein